MLKKDYIDFNNNYVILFSEEESRQHPLGGYFFKPYDYSINIIISLKWFWWSYEFFNYILNNINEYDLINYQKNNIQNNILIKQTLIKEEKILIIDNTILDNNLNKILINYENKLFNKNTLIHFKLKLNIDEFIMLSYFLHPTICKINKITK